MTKLNYLWLLILILLFSNCFKQNISDQNNSIVGCWEKSIKQEQYIFSIRLTSANKYQGTVTTFRDDQKVDEMPLADISFTGLQLTMVTNPEQNVVFKGELDSISQSITGKLYFANGSTFPFKLQRYVGQKCRGSEEAAPVRVLQYKNIENLPALELGINQEIEVNNLKKQESEPKVSKEDAIACINRWQGKIYPSYPKRSSALFLAFLLDPITVKISNTWKNELANLSSLDEKVTTINRWTIENMAYTQANPLFLDFPGKDPWGTFPNSLHPVFKKLIPSEMQAMQFYTGKISGKCFTLVNLVLSGFIQLGVDPNDMLVLIIKSGRERHAMALVKFEGELLLVNLMMVDKLSKHIQQDFGNYEIMGIYNGLFSSPTALKITNADLKTISMQNHTKPLQDVFIDYFQLDVDANRFASLSNLVLSDRSALYQSIFNRPESGSVLELAGYAYQSLKVSHPEFYLEASLQSSLPRELVKKLHSVEDIFQWIKEHIRYGSIFEDSEERLMTADQVLVFQRGSFKDQALLACTLLKHIGIEAQITISKVNAYLLFNKQIYDLKNQSYVSLIEEPLLTISSR